MVEFELHGKPMGEVERVVITDTHIVTHLCDGEVGKMRKDLIASPSLLVSELHRKDVDITYE